MFGEYRGEPRHAALTAPRRILATSLGHSASSQHRASLQSLQEPEALSKCRAIAERGLSDLQAYAAVAGSSDPSITLKGATV
jgi:hypothetical protein